jgi:integrase
MSFTLKRPRAGRKYWTAILHIPGEPDQEIGTGCAKRSEARVVAERRHKEAATASHRLTMMALFEMYIGMKGRAGRADGTLSKLDDKAGAMCKFFKTDGEPGGRNVYTLALSDTTAYVAYRRERDVSDGTIAMEMSTLVAALRYLKQHGKYDRDPSSLWPPELPHEFGKKRKRWMPWAEYLRLLAAIAAKWRDHLVLYCMMGLRRGELYRIEPGHVDLESRTCIVIATKTPDDDGEPLERTVPLNADAYEVLARRLQGAAPGQPLFGLQAPNWDAHWVAWSRNLTRAAEKAGIEHVMTVDCRRTFATWCAQQGVDETICIKWMGHRTTEMIRTVYRQIAKWEHAREGEKIPSRRRFPGEVQNLDQIHGGNA